MHVEELANRLQATFLDGGWGGIRGGYIRLSSMTSCLSRVGQRASLVLWCGHLWSMLRSLNQSKAWEKSTNGSFSGLLELLGILPHAAQDGASTRVIFHPL